MKILQMKKNLLHRLRIFFMNTYKEQIYRRERVSINFAKDHQISRDENETDEAFTKRLKKINYLNLAQQLIRNSNQSGQTKTRQIVKSDLKSSNNVSIFILYRIKQIHSNIKFIFRKHY